MSSLLSPQWLERLQQYEQLIVAFSGGLDSTALLFCLACYPSLSSRITAVHINHGLSPHALAWQRHCEQFCRNLNLAFLAESVTFNRTSNIEEEARTARYAVFSRLSHQGSCLLLGHHLNDQAETVLLQLFRGAGVDGLCGMSELDSFSEGATIARPFLPYTREQLYQYALAHGLKWIEDESNSEIYFSRNYLRNEIMPLLHDKWPGLVANIARAGSHCQQARDNLYELALLDCQEIVDSSSSLSIASLQHLDEGRLINVLRVWFKKNKVRAPSAIITKQLIKELLGAKQDAIPLIQWGDVAIRRSQGRIYLEKNASIALPKEIAWSDFPKPLKLAEEYVLHAKKTAKGLVLPTKASIKVKFREGGETITLHQQTKLLKKLFQEWQVPCWERNRIPLIYINNQLAVVVGYAISDLFYSQKSSAFTIDFKLS